MDRKILYGAAFLRALGIGLLGVILALTLAAGGFHAGQIGLLVGVGLAGNACATFFVTFRADQIGRRRTLIALGILMALGGLGLVFFSGFPALLAAAFLGMVNGMGRERGALFTLEQAILPETTRPEERTKILAWYNLTIDVGMGLGSLLGGLPILLRSQWGLTDLASYQGTLLLYAAFGAGTIFLYMGLSPRVEIRHPTPWQKVSAPSRRIITHLSFLFGFDSLAGGFLPSTLVAYWFFKRFGAGEQMLAPLFLTAHVANAFSYLAATWISRRIGLVRTMVFTHIPANLCLVLLPFVPSLPMAVLLYLLRESLVEMDVPTRQSYVLAMVAPSERTIASGATNLTRVAAWTVGPSLAGLAMKGAWLSFPLFLGGGLKILYDLLLYRAFRHRKPPEELARPLPQEEQPGG